MSAAVVPRPIFVIAPVLIHTSDDSDLDSTDDASAACYY